jgi:hypothetical protein
VSFGKVISTDRDDRMIGITKRKEIEEIKHYFYFIISRLQVEI